VSKIEPEWLPDRQVADFLGVTTMTIWRWDRDEKLGFPRPAVIHGRKYRNRNKLNEWMRSMATNKAGQPERAA
jgi:excisionase family DNA binding protein